MASTILNLQVLLVAVKIYNTYKTITHGQLHGQKIEMSKLVEGLFSIPFILASLVLMVRFRNGFSITTNRNIIYVSVLMMSENASNMTLKFAEGVKHIFLDLTLVTNLVVPAALFCIWFGIFVVAYGKDGDYGAPPGMLYIQQEDEQIKRERQFIKELEKAQKLSSYSLLTGTSASSNEQTNQPFLNETIINYDDENEQLPEFDESEYVPLFQRATVNNDKPTEDIVLDEGFQVRRSCPDEQRKKLS